MNWLSEKLNIKTMEDWYNISLEVKIKLIKETKNRTQGYTK